MRPFQINRAFLDQTCKMDSNGVEYSKIEKGFNGADYVTGDNHEFFFKKPLYGRDMIRIVQVERIGKN